jgi:membrane protease YdiL (CAAX protease family)
MEPNNDVPSIPQYSLGKILLVWAAAAIPMGIMGWLVGPALAPDPQNLVQFITVRFGVLTVGLIWQFILVLIMLHQETGTLQWKIIKPRLWLNAPRSPQTGETRGRLWWWLIPLILLIALFEMQVEGIAGKLWVSVFPFLAEPKGWSLGAVVATPESKSLFVGAWGIWGFFLVNALFNTVLGEELLFRGLLLPRMAGVFGRADWLMNGLLMGIYHFHTPWVMLGAAISGMFLFAFPSRYFRSSWFGIIVHSMQSVYFAFLILGLVLGLA